MKFTQEEKTAFKDYILGHQSEEQRNQLIENMNHTLFGYLETGFSRASQCLDKLIRETKEEE